MWLRFSSLLLLGAFSTTSAAKLNFLGDTLAPGEMHVSSTTLMRDSHSSAEYVANSSTDATDDLARSFSDANRKAYGFATEVTYLMGITSDFNIGLRYGYEYDKHDTKIDSASAAAREGEWSSEGGTDLTLLGKYRLDESSSVDVELQLPMCSTDAASDLCNSKLAIPENAEQTGRNGGQGKGYYRLKSAMSSNWITEMDTHWQGSIHGAITLADDVFGEKVSSPFTYGASFGAIMPIKKHHQWTGTLSIERMLEYSAYSEQIQTEVRYGRHARTSFTAEYLWDFLGPFQLRPFADFSIVQRPSEKFQINGLDRSLEYTAGTEVTIGASVSASF